MKHKLIAMLCVAPMVLLETSPSFAKSFFNHPPTQVVIHNPESTEGRSNRTTITIAVPRNAGNALGAIILRQLPTPDKWDWGHHEPHAYIGNYSLHQRGTSGLASAITSDSGEALKIQFSPTIKPGQTVNVIFRSLNPEAGIYQWSTELLADGDDPVHYMGPILRVNIYEQSPYP